MSVDRIREASEISALKEMEEELRQAQRKFREARKRIALLEIVLAAALVVALEFLFVSACACVLHCI